MKRLFSLFLVLILSCSLTYYAMAEDANEYGYGFINRNGDVVIAPQYDYAYSFSDGRARVFSGSISRWGSPDEGKYGFIDQSGNLVINFIYDDATDFSNGLSYVKRNGKYGAIDADGNVVIDFRYDYMSGLGDNVKAFVGTLSDYGSPKNGSYDILTSDGTVKFSIKCQYLYSYDGYYEASNGDKYAIVAEDGTMLTEYKWDSLTAEGKDILGYKSGDKYGYIDTIGNVIIAAQYDSIGTFVDGKAIVMKNGKYYLIDTSGNILQNYKSDYVSTSIVDGHTYAFEGSLTSYNVPDSGKYYLMNLDGEYITPGYVKGDCYSIHDKKLTWRVQDGTKWGVVDLQGNIVFPFTECDSLYYCGSDYIIKKNDKYALVGADGTEKTEYIYDDMRYTDEDLIAVNIAKIEPDFRSTRWGMSMEEVKALEGSNPDYSGKVNGANANYIGYDTSLMGNDVIVAYYFGSNGLYSARYIWTARHSNDSMYISDYESVKAQLTKKYGSPLIDNENWDTTSHKKYYADEKGNALSFGYLTYETLYWTNRTYITMNMSADNYNISFIINYESSTITAPQEDYSDLF